MMQSQPPTPSVPQTQVVAPRMGTLNKSYISSKFPFLGILRIAIIICLFAGWVSAAAVFKVSVPNGNEYSDTRTAYLVISILAFLISIAIFVLCLFNFIDFSKGVIIKLVVVIQDLVFAVTLFALGIVCAVMESKFRNFSSAWIIVRYELMSFFICCFLGAFASASFFAFLSSLLLGFIAFIQYRFTQN